MQAKSWMMAGGSGPNRGFCLVMRSPQPTESIQHAIIAILLAPVLPLLLSLTLHPHPPRPSFVLRCHCFVVSAVAPLNYLSFQSRSQSAILNPQSAILNPQSSIHNPSLLDTTSTLLNQLLLPYTQSRVGSKSNKPPVS